MNIGILGYGEVGTAINALYDGRDFSDMQIEIEDKNKEMRFDEQHENFDILHVCIPYGDSFVEQVINKIKDNLIIKNGVTIIHSTVAVGTTDKIYKAVITDVVHSPIRGGHDNMIADLRIFPKFIGMSTDCPVGIYFRIKNHFNDLGIETKLVIDSKTTELGKLLDTTYYGLCISYHQYAKELCDKEGLDFNIVMEEFNFTYNNSMVKNKTEKFVRPNLYPPEGAIGGHCIVPNVQILRDSYGDDSILKRIK